MPAAFHIEGYRSYLGAQLRAGGEVLGVLSCYREQGGFSLNHVSVLSALAEQLGVVIENHRLRQQAEETAIVSERQRLARELHDAVTQSLYSQALFARAAHNALEEGDRARLQDSLGQLGANAASALREMRLLLHQLRPAALEAGGLAQAIDDRLELVERRVGITAECRVDGRIQAGSDTEVMLYRVALEALNNALRHANATRVAVHVRARGGSVRLVVSDNGCGFDPARVSGGMGLAGMRERVRQQGGQLKITSAPGRGTVVRVSVSPAGETSGARRRSHE
jgi:signal transduction histidine kinase